MNSNIPENILILSDSDSTWSDCVRQFIATRSVPHIECTNLYEAIRQLSKFPPSLPVLFISRYRDLHFEQKHFIKLLNANENWRCCFILNGRDMDLCSLKQLFWDGRIFSVRSLDELKSFLQWLPEKAEPILQEPCLKKTRMERIKKQEYQLTPEELDAVLGQNL